MKSIHLTAQEVSAVQEALKENGWNVTSGDPDLPITHPLAKNIFTKGDDRIMTFPTTDLDSNDKTYSGIQFQINDTKTAKEIYELVAKQLQPLTDISLDIRKANLHDAVFADSTAKVPAQPEIPSSVPPTSKKIDADAKVGILQALLEKAGVKTTLGTQLVTLPNGTDILEDRLHIGENAFHGSIGIREVGSKSYVQALFQENWDTPGKDADFLKAMDVILQNTGAGKLFSTQETAQVKVRQKITEASTDARHHISDKEMDDIIKLDNGLSLQVTPVYSSGDTIAICSPVMEYEKVLSLHYNTQHPKAVYEDNYKGCAR